MLFVLGFILSGVFIVVVFYGMGDGIKIIVWGILFLVLFGVKGYGICLGWINSVLMVVNVFGFFVFVYVM